MNVAVICISARPCNVRGLRVTLTADGYRPGGAMGAPLWQAMGAEAEEGRERAPRVCVVVNPRSAGAAAALKRLRGVPGRAFYE